MNEDETRFEITNDGPGPRFRNLSLCKIRLIDDMYSTSLIDEENIPETMNIDEEVEKRKN